MLYLRITSVLYLMITSVLHLMITSVLYLMIASDDGTAGCDTQQVYLLTRIETRVVNAPTP